jgi:hypothetical protein
MKYAASKFEKEFYFISHHIMSEEGLQEGIEELSIKELEQKKLNYVKLGQLLTELGFIPLNITSDSIERELLFDLWNLQKGELNNGITIRNIKKVLLAV